MIPTFLDSFVSNGFRLIQDLSQGLSYPVPFKPPDKAFTNNKSINNN